uniref:Uncharacterized protein n=1 Tax=Panagrolaimus davidi TaxID=227884 RepID=A0A914R053_9BILA
MNFLLVAVVLFSLIFEIANAKCDSRGLQQLEQCYGSLMDTGAVPPSFLEDPKTMQGFDRDFASYCKIHYDKFDCLGYYGNTCLNIPTFSKVFGFTERESLDILITDFKFEYFCSRPNIRKFLVKEKK